MSTIKIAARFDKAVEQPTGPAFFLIKYQFSSAVISPSGPVLDGGVEVDLTGMTETEANALIQQAVADHANAATSNVEAFTIDDVRGGRI